MTRHGAIWACVALLALAACGESATNALVVARRALADGLWSVAETNAARAAADEGLRSTARLVQLEALARAGRATNMVALVESWPEEKTEGVRYWHAWALVEGRRLDAARPLLAEPFADPAYAPLAIRLAARLELAAGARDAAEERFKQASAALGTNGTDRAANAVEWANARLSFGDLAGARTVLADEKAVEAPGSVGDAARLLAGNLAARAGDTNAAHRLWGQLVEGGKNTEERAYVLAACALSDDFWSAGETNKAIAAASNAVARAMQPELVRQAGFRLGFALLRQSTTRAAGVEQITSLLRRFPGTDESRVAHLRFADTLLALGEAEAAEREFSALLQTYPEHSLDVHVLAGRGWAMLESGRRTEAVGVFARAAQAATNAADRAVCIFKQGDALLADGRFTEAAEAYARVSPEGGADLHARARFQQADSLARAGQTAEAIKIFSELASGSADAELAFSAGMRTAALESAAGRFESAIALYTKLLEKKEPTCTDAQRVDVLYGRGKAFYSAYRFAEAEADFAAVAKLLPSRAPEMAFLSARCLYAAGRDNEAADAARKLLAAEGAQGRLRADVEYWLAKYEFGHGNYATALAGFASCATNKSLSAGRRIEALGRAARCCAAQSDYAGVVEYATRATTNAVAVRAIAKTTPETAAVAEVFVLQAEALMELARFNEAVLVLSRAQLLAAPPELLRRAAVLKADCLFAMGADDDRRYVQALEAYRTVLQGETLTPSMRLALAFKIGRSLEKLRRFEEAADQYYTHVVTAYCDGVRAKTGFDGDARAFFTRAVFILADYYESRGEVRPAIRVLDYLVKTGVPAAREARQRIQRLEEKKGGAW